MPVTEKTVFIVNGMQFDTRELADAHERKWLIAEAVQKLRTYEGQTLIGHDALIVGELGAEILQILKWHLGDEPRELSEDAPIDEARAKKFFLELFKAYPTGISQGDIADMIIPRRHELVAILQGMKMPAIDEAAAAARLGQIIDVYESPNSETWIGEQIVRKRAQIIPLLQGIEPPAPICEKEAVFKIASIKNSGEYGEQALQIVKRRAEVIAILQGIERKTPAPISKQEARDRLSGEGRDAAAVGAVVESAPGVFSILGELLAGAADGC